MKEVSRRRDIGHYNVVISSQLQKTLGARIGVFGPLSFVAVGQQHYQARRTIPLGFAGRNELVDHHLSPVGKIAKLGLPNHQSLRGSHRVAKFKPKYRVLRQQRVIDHELFLLGLNMVQAVVGFVGFRIVQYSMAVREGTPLNVLPT